MENKSASNSSLVAWLATPICVVLGACFVLVIGGSVEGFQYSGALLPVVLAFLIQWIAFVPAFLLKTEKFYDLVGGLSFVSVVLVALYLAPNRSIEVWVLFLFVIVWAGRLSLFLFLRVHRAKSDRRFDEIKRSFPKFLFAWTAQGLWVTFSLAPVLAVMASSETHPLGFFFWFGAAVWIFGFAVEVIADRQKSQFKQMPANQGAFIQSGLWALSRHPNYFGEIVLWSGIALLAFPVLSGWQYLCLSSPVFIFTLLRFISGVPMLEKAADERWGSLDSYRKYKDATPLLFPRFPVR